MSISQKFYNVGWALYVAGQPYSACHNADMRRGYLAANRAEAECAIAGFADKVGW